MQGHVYDASTGALLEKLKGFTNRGEVRLEEQVDEALLGGIVVVLAAAGHRDQRHDPARCGRDPVPGAGV